MNTLTFKKKMLLQKAIKGKFKYIKYFVIELRSVMSLRLLYNTD